MALDSQRWDLSWVEGEVVFRKRKKSGQKGKELLCWRGQLRHACSTSVLGEPVVSWGDSWVGLWEHSCYLWPSICFLVLVLTSQLLTNVTCFCPAGLMVSDTWHLPRGSFPQAWVQTHCRSKRDGNWVEKTRQRKYPLKNSSNWYCHEKYMVTVRLLYMSWCHMCI